MNGLRIIHARKAPLPVSVCESRYVIAGIWRASAETIERYSPSHGVLLSRSAKGTQAATKAASGALKTAALELGGNNPQVIFPDADLARAVDTVAFDPATEQRIAL